MAVESKSSTTKDTKVYPGNPTVHAMPSCNFVPFVVEDFDFLCSLRLCG
jgi:hypothetical protein